MLFTPKPARPTQIEPLIGIQLFGHTPAYQPGSVLRCDVQIDAVDKDALQSVEVSVLWSTDGKGDEDMGVHYFERRVPADVPENDLRQLRSFSVELPNAPLSYEGEILQIRWCVRVRLFMKGGQDHREDYGFRLAVLDRQAVVDVGLRAPGIRMETDVSGVKRSVRSVASGNVQNQNCEA